ncbi:MAG TPA: hypothetical protein VFW98_01705 [Gemmatimonadaceae bacterium]|nr:hypothetical protein [Gemmatimonadaceae bacterium]
MSRSLRYLAAPLALSVALVAGGCGDHGQSNALSQDSSLSRDLALANKDTAAQPQLSDTATAPTAQAPAPTEKPAATTTPKRTTPRHRTPKRTTPSKPAAPPPPVTTASGNTVATPAKGSSTAVGQIAQGTTVALSSGKRVCTNTSHPGDRFTATVNAPVIGSNGAVIPKGAKAVVEVSSVKSSTHAGDPMQMAFIVQSIVFDGKTYPVTSEITHVDVQKVRNSSTGSDAKKVVGGAVIGAILGQVLGKNTKSTVIGAATGAAAGTAVAMGTADYIGCIPEGGAIQIKLDQPMTVKTE